MKKKMSFILAAFITFMFTGCSNSPSIEDVEESTREGVENLLTEDNSKKVSMRMDRYFLSEQVDDLTYTGTVKTTVFLKYGRSTDSLKVYRPVTIKFRSKKYDYYTISIGQARL